MEKLATRHDVGAEQDAARRRLEAHIAAVVDAAPPLTEEQASRLRELIAVSAARHNTVHGTD